MKSFINRFHLLFLALVFVACILSTTCAKADGVPYVTDKAELLTDADRTEIENTCASIEQTDDVKVIIITENSIDTDRKTYLEDYYDANLADSDSQGVVLLLINMDSSKRGFEIQGYKDSEYHINDNVIQGLVSDMTPHLKDAQYYAAITLFLSQVKEYSETEPSSNYTHAQVDNEAYDIAHSNEKPIYYELWFQLVVSIIIGGIVVFIMAFNSGGKMTVNQGTYLDGEHSRLLARRDRYIRTSITKVRRPKESSGGSSSGGGVSSGGSSHSGGGGSF